MSGSSPFRRNPLVINGNALSSGDRTTRFTAGDPGSLLRNYLVFVRELRDQRRAPSIELRTEDITVLAHHLGVTEEVVLGGLLDLMGATRAERSTMFALLATGALTIVLSGTIVTSLSADGLSVEMGRLADAVQDAVSGADGSSATTSRAGAATSEPTTVASRPPETSNDRQTGLGDAAVGTPTPDVLRSAAATPSSDGASIEPAAIRTPAVRSSDPDTDPKEAVSVGRTDDGSLVASIAPPVPEPSDEPVATGELPDGTTVAVAAPPVPPPPTDEPVATGQLPDGTTVAVAAPPVPPPVVPDG